MRVGRYGFPISDEGSGVNLGLKSVQLGACAHDGRYGRRPLQGEIMRQRFETSAKFSLMDRPKPLTRVVDGMALATAGVLGAYYQR